MANLPSYDSTASLQQTLQILEKLVGFNTISDQSNLPLLAFVQDYLSQHQVEHQLVTAPAEHAAASDKDKANLWASIGPKDTAGIALSGHTDVVPVVGQDWDTDPFTLHITQDKAYGRGTCDMKGFLACALAMMPYFAKLPLKKPIMLYFSYNEEVGCTGVAHLIRELGQNLPAPEAIIVGEPSNMKTLSAHKSMLYCETIVTGRGGHSSNLPQGVSATMIAARLVNFINDMLVENQQKAKLLSDDSVTNNFEPPYTGLHVGILEGGTALNIIAHHARFLWDVRGIAGDDSKEYPRRLHEFADTELLPAMRAIAPESDIQTRFDHCLPAFEHVADSAAEMLVRRLSGDNSVNYASYMAETGLFQAAGFPSIIYGPGSIAQAHQPNEWVGLDQLQQCLDFLAKLGQDLCD